MAGFPERGIRFPHVRNGDSSTIVIRDGEFYFQVDIHHTDGGEESDDEREDVIDILTDVLPKKEGQPYLSVFALTHPDQDHCRGFERLLDEVVIGEILHTPRIFQQYEDDDDLCDDAKAFRDECERRRDEMISVGGDPGLGDRVRIIGYSDTFERSEYENFPEAFRHVAGDTITRLDEDDLDDVFELFVHGPLKDEHGGDRNDSSLAFQATLTSDDGQHKLNAIFLGDRSAPKIRSIIEQTESHDNKDRLDWNVLLAPHHCSQKALYEEENGSEKPQDDIINCFSDGAQNPAYVIASCRAVDEEGSSAFTDGNGDDPPHKKARRRYETMLQSEDDFLCTGERPNTENPEAIAILLDNDGLRYGDGGSQGGGQDGDGGDKGTPPPVGWGSDSSKEPSSSSIDHGSK